MVFAGYDRKGLSVSGLFQWTKAFQQLGATGDSNASITKDALERYDIVHVNYVPRNASYIAAIRDSLGKNSSTKLILNVDFGLMMWNKTDPWILKSMLDKADMVFHVEPTGAARLSRLLEREVPCIPHPVDTVMAKRMQSEMAEDDPVIWACQYHRYFGTWSDYFYATNQLKKEYDARTLLFNVTSQEVEGRVPLNSYFDELISEMEHAGYLKMMSKCYINLDITPDYTYGRGVVEAACLKIPTITNMTSYAGRLLFPPLTTTWAQDDITRRLIRTLMEHPDAMKEAAEYGAEHAEYFGLKQSYERMCVALEIKQ
jgi:hypothetical protein